MTSFWTRALEERWRRWWVFAALAVVTAGGALLRLYDLGRAGVGSTFYASAIYSMGQSLHNFLYAAYDPAGTILTDKPPLALWLQVASTKVFGFEGWAMILPIALAGTVAIPLVFLGARRTHSVAAGLLAALALAVFPESVATARDSTMDALMMAMLAGAAVLLIAAVEGRRPRLLIAWAVVMGLIFNVKYFEGFVVMPAAAIYLLVVLRHEWRQWVMPVAGAAAVVVVVSLSWVTFVELTPAEDRPIVLNDEDNSAFGLVARYNGLERVLPGEVTIFTAVDPNAEASAGLIAAAQQFGVGDRGPLRFVRGSNGALLGASIVLALAGIGLVAWRRRDWLDVPGLFWIAWCLTGLALFTVSNRAAAHYHESYAPALAVLIGVGLVEAGRLTDRWRALVLPSIVLTAAAVGWVAVRNHATLHTEVRAAVVLAVLAALAVMVLARRRSWFGRWLWVAPAVLVLAIPLTSSLYIAREAPRGGQITRPNPLVYAADESRGAGDRSVPIDQLFTRFGRIDGEYQLAIDGVNNAGEVVAYTGASVLPIYNEYLRTPLLAAEDLDARLASGDPPFVLLTVARFQQGLLDEVLPIVTRHCAFDSDRQLARGWILFDCR